VDHTADIAADLEGDSMEELFSAATEVFKLSVTDYNCLQTSDSIEIELTGTSAEELLVNFLNEINFYLTMKKWLCCNIVSIKIFNCENNWELSVELNGVNLNSDIVLNLEIKSVTYHQMEITKKNNCYHTRVVFDI
jgi:SHS2 domain-containing protein